MNAKPKILVTGSTGKTGEAVVTELLKHDWPVRAMVSREDNRSARLRKMGAEIAVARQPRGTNARAGDVVGLHANHRREIAADNCLNQRPKVKTRDDVNH